MKWSMFVLMVVASLSLAACGRGSRTAPSPTTCTVGGTVVNLAGTGGGLQLEDNGSDPLLVNANGAFTFPKAIARGSAYSVTVSGQPSAPGQTCEVSHGTGTATANVTSVLVDCGHGEWTWVNGANVADQKGTYGARGTAAAGNLPGAREGAVSWTDAAGNFWLFGGLGYDPAGTWGDLNDLWKYSAGQWTWVGGSKVVNQKGTYGTEGTAAAGNVPGGRVRAVGWTDAAGNFWLFGGFGYDSTGTEGEGVLNDLWKYSAGEWTWRGGSKVVNQRGTYGTEGTAAAANIPRARSSAVAWTDEAGNFWLFGGLGYDPAGTWGDLNDLWKYSAGEWTWMGGSKMVKQKGTYGIQRTAAPSNVPGARSNAIAWTDAAGNFWLFGGSGIDSAGTEQMLNDLWRYSAGEWTWMGGSKMVKQKGTYGIERTAAAGNLPGARQGAVSWADAAGNFWLFGGEGIDSAGTEGMLNDLWKYSAGQWTWMGGSEVHDQKGTYGTQGMAALGNAPGARESAATWTDGAGNLWLFGGCPGVLPSYLNDLWMYEP